jgi:hypothetical protein
LPKGGTKNSNTRKKKIQIPVLPPPKKEIKKNVHYGQVWWCMSVVPVLVGGNRTMTSSRLAMVKVARPCLKNSKKGLGYGSNGRELPYHA